MQAIIMAGGKGTRLSSVSKSVPKPMIPICDRPLLEYQIVKLNSCGFDEIIIITGFMGEVIREHFGNSVDYFEEEEPLGTAGALKKIKDRLQDDFALVFGDIFFEADIEKFFTFHKEKNSLVTLYVHPNSHPYDSDIVITDTDGFVVDWNKKNTDRKTWLPNQVNAGLYILSKKAIDFLPDTAKCDLESDLITRLIPERKVTAYKCSEYVKDIGTPDRYYQVCKDVMGGRIRKNKAIFIDRDGTINKYKGFLTEMQNFELLPNVADAIKAINNSDYYAIVVTNQPVIARGEVSWQKLNEIHNKMETLLGEQGAYIDGLYICPHHPDKGFEGERPEYKIDCNCRKPKPGMLLKAAEDYGIDLTESWMIGDDERDENAGKNAGSKTIRIETDGSLLKAVERILKKDNELSE